jgi:hypothetical protein
MTAGRPAMFNSVEEMEDGITAYFKSLEYEFEGMVNSKPATLAGLAYSLGFSDRASLYDYKGKPEFTHTIKRARLYIESMYEEGLQSKNSTGCIFALKNLGWKDKQEIDNKLSGEVKSVIDASKLKEAITEVLANDDC